MAREGTAVPRTEEQEAACHGLAEAIARASAAFGKSDEFVVSSWVVVLQTENLTDPEDEGYQTLTQSASTPRFHSLGLLHTGIELMQESWRSADS